MYESYWQFEKRPFENTSDQRFYYPGEAHQGALLKLRYAVENRRGAALLTGASGLGKTLVVRTLAEQVPPRFQPFVHLVFPQLPPEQLLAYLADELTAERTGGEPPLHESLGRITQMLSENYESRRHAVVVVDEAHLLQDPVTLDMLRLLTNFEWGGEPALTLLLVGQPSLLPMLDRMPELDERLAVKSLLTRFTSDDTSAYVHHRLSVAGARQKIFTDDAVDAIHHLAQGIPRRINRLCDLALLIGYAEELSSIDAAHIESVAEELITVAAD